MCDFVYFDLFSLIFLPSIPFCPNLLFSYKNPDFSLIWGGYFSETNCREFGGITPMNCNFIQILGNTSKIGQPNRVLSYS